MCSSQNNFSLFFVVVAKLQLVEIFKLAFDRYLCIFFHYFADAHSLIRLQKLNDQWTSQMTRVRDKVKIKILKKLKLGKKLHYNKMSYKFT